MEKFLLLFCGLLAVSQGQELENLGLRIVNGQKVALGERPFQVSLKVHGWFHFCGGSIINQNFVLTTTSCIFLKSYSTVKVIGGTVDLINPGVIRQAKKFIQHENYVPPFRRNDIALIQVSIPFSFDAYLQPVPLPKLHQEVATNSTAIVSGWGFTGQGSKAPSNELLQAKIYIVDQKYCENVMSNRGKYIYSTNVCAYDPTMRRGICNEDNGGPLTVNGTLTGIVSWFREDPYCAYTEYPGVYTRVSEYIDWIEKNTNKSD